jgi:chromosome segregation ATPase
MTDKEIIQALEYCINPTSDCENCPYYKNDECFDVAKGDALNLIVRQQAEIENYSHNIRMLTAGNLQLQARIKELKKEREVLVEDIHNLSDQVNEQLEEIEEVRIGVKSYKGKYESTVRAAKEYQSMIKEKDAEIERLLQKLQQPQTEAIKEFAEKFEAYIPNIEGETTMECVKNAIKQTLKEMVGEQK